MAALELRKRLPLISSVVAQIVMVSYKYEI